MIYFLLGLFFVNFSSAQHDVQAICVFTATKASGTNVAGVTYFTEHRGHTVINATITGLEPKSTHGFHIHEFGNMNSDDGKATGGHWNPDGVDHACPETATPHHVGDLGNIVADDKGTAQYHKTFKGVPFTGSHGIMGRGMIVHHDADDCKTQPTGNAGSRLAQCVIGWL